jgi:uncharacterized protein (TIGR02391 family)
MDMNKLNRLYGRLRGIRDFTFTQNILPKHVGDDYNRIVNDIATLTDDDLSSFLLPGDFYYSSYGGGELECRSAMVQSKVLQFVSFLEYGYNLSQQTIEIGSIYNSITDEKLKSRCSDILSAPGNFDRVINQATLVLEDRIRKQSGLTQLSGVDLVNKALNSDLSKSLLRVSDNSDEHEGIAHICRGMVLAFRNPTHHRIIADITREDALKVCAFIDKLLQIVDATKPKAA